MAKELDSGAITGPLLDQEVLDKLTLAIKAAEDTVIAVPGPNLPPKYIYCILPECEVLCGTEAFRVLDAALRDTVYRRRTSRECVPF